MNDRNPVLDGFTFGKVFENARQHVKWWGLMQPYIASLDLSRQTLVGSGTRTYSVSHQHWIVKKSSVDGYLGLYEAGPEYRKLS